MNLLTPAEVAAALGISPRQLRDLTDDGALPFINVGRGRKRPARRYEPADVEAFKALRRRVEECPSTGVRDKRNSATTSGIGVVDFRAERERRRVERQKLSNRWNARKPAPSSPKPRAH